MNKAEYIEQASEQESVVGTRLCRGVWLWVEARKARAVLLDKAIVRVCDMGMRGG